MKLVKIELSAKVSKDKPLTGRKLVHTVEVPITDTYAEAFSKYNGEDGILKFIQDAEIDAATIQGNSRIRNTTATEEALPNFFSELTKWASEWVYGASKRGTSVEKVATNLLANVDLSALTPEQMLEKMQLLQAALAAAKK